MAETAKKTEAEAETELLSFVPMDPVKTVDAGARAAFAIVPPDYDVRSLEPYQDGPNRITARPVFRDVASLAVYCATFETVDTLAFSDWGKHSISVVFDYHAASAAHHCDHIAAFKAEFSKPWQKWRAMDDKGVTQITFGRFLEEQAHHIVRPDAASVIELCMNFEAIRKVDFKSAVRLQNGTRQISYVEADEVRGSVVVPETIDIRLPIFEGMDPQVVTVRFRYRIDEGKLFLALTFDNLDELEREAFDRCVDALKIERKSLTILNSRTID